MALNDAAQGRHFCSWLPVPDAEPVTACHCPVAQQLHCGYVLWHSCMRWCLTVPACLVLFGLYCALGIFLCPVLVVVLDTAGYCFLAFKQFQHVNSVAISSSALETAAQPRTHV